jgi:hypothetical protein
MTAMRSIAKHYDQLDGPERFVAMLEAMARGDEEEDKRLDDACPRGTYVIDEPSYRSRMHMSFTAASLVCASINRDLDVIRTLGVVQDVTNLYELVAMDGAEEAFYAGWRARGGSSRKANKALDPEAERELEALCKQAVEQLNVSIRCVREVAGGKRAVSLLSAWEGLGRFSRECCQVEPLVLTKAWRLLAEDPVAEVMTLHPEAVVDEVQANGWYTSLSTTWRRREEML